MSLMGEGWAGVDGAPEQQKCSLERKLLQACFLARTAEGMTGAWAAPYHNWPRRCCLGSHCPHHR